MKKERYKITTAVYAVIISNSQILLSLRKNTGFMDGKYGLVSGHVEENETLVEAMIREAKEEAGIDIRKLKLATTMFRHKITEDGNDYIDFYFMVEDFNGDIVNNEPDKCGSLEFFDINNLPDNIINYVKFGIDNVLDSNNYCEM